jgi:hypothetical protein
MISREKDIKSKKIVQSHQDQEPTSITNSIQRLEDEEPTIFFSYSYRAGSTFRHDTINIKYTPDLTLSKIKRIIEQKLKPTPEDVNIEIDVRLPEVNNTITTVKITPDTTISAIKGLIQEQTGIPAETQTIVAAGRKYDDEKTLNAYGEYENLKKEGIHLFGRHLYRRTPEDAKNNIIHILNQKADELQKKIKSRSSIFTPIPFKINGKYQALTNLIQLLEGNLAGLSDNDVNLLQDGKTGGIIRDKIVESGLATIAFGEEINTVDNFIRAVKDEALQEEEHTIHNGRDIEMKTFF